MKAGFTKSVPKWKAFKRLRFPKEGREARTWSGLAALEEATTSYLKLTPEELQEIMDADYYDQ